MWGFPASATRASFRYSHFSGLGHRNTAISVEACSDGKFIVTSAEQGYSVPTTSLTWKFRLKCGREVSKMRNPFRVSVIMLSAALTLSLLAFAQNARSQQSGPPKDRKATTAPAPVHDISGTWEPANGPNDGIRPEGWRTGNPACL